MDVVVTGIGLYSSLGSLRRTWRKLLEGETGIGIHQPFPELPPLPLGLIAERPDSIDRLTELAIIDALEDAGLSAPLVDCGVSIGSSRGCQGIWEEMARSGKVENWLDSLGDRASVIAARHLGTIAPVLSPMAACATGIWSIASGFDLIRFGQCDRVLAGAVEAPITPLTLAGFDRAGAMASTGCYPFDKEREGLVLAEGAAILVLESEESARMRNASIYGKISGYGFTCDASHVSAPATDNLSAMRAIEGCLQRSGLKTGEIDYIHAHGTSTRLNDEREANLIKSLFPAGIPISSTKGATGHTLGASGALGVAFCLLALKHQILPPCVGLRESAFELNFVRSALSVPLKNALCFSFGFGGQNVAISIGRVD
ncbi:beta-ketoacyl-ACP synthase [Pannus brasiliensis CCIBt3594]|uniref:Beta-ketoacyl-ACP synthase n=1 Tax=Pannus brasiliensis CCIBt3594 TaxID=1427578 RepID=A0AAW9QTW7_9CHRO